MLPLLLLAPATAAALLLAGHGSGPGIAVIAAVRAASLVSSIAGFAFSAICGALLFHLWPDQIQVVQTMIVCSIANQLAMVWSLRREMEVRLLGRYLLGGAIGLPLGVDLLLHADHTVYTHALGLLLLGYGLYMLLARPARIAAPGCWTDVAAGFAGGITGVAAGFPGGPVTIWCGLQGWDKVRQRALFQPFILVMQVAALVAISVVHRSGGGGSGFGLGALLCVPAGLLGTWLGMGWFRRISNRQFGLMVNGLLIVSGLSFVI